MNLKTLLVGGAGLLVSAPAFAQSGQPSLPAGAQPATDSRHSGEGVGQVEEVVVTAQRREERLQSVPMTVTALTANTLQGEGVADTASLQAAVPGLIINKAVSSAVTFIRGIGQDRGVLGVENSVATYLDGVYLSQSSSQLFTLNNIQRVEVLEGPQGTLFGRNATGGVINVITRNPGDGGANSAELGYGNYQQVAANLFLDHRFTGAWSANFSAYVNNEGQGYVHDIALNKELYQDYANGVQSKLRWQPDSKTDIVANMLYGYSKGFDGTTIASPPPGTRNQIGQAYLGNYVVDNGVDAPNTVTQELEYLRAAQDFDNFRVINTAAFHQVHEQMTFDQNGLPPGYHAAVIAPFDNYGRTFTDEAQIQSLSGSKTQWIAGTFYMHDTTDTHYTVFLDTTPLQRVHDYLVTDSVAGFVQGSAQVLPKTNLTLGARYTVDERSFSGVETTGAGAVIATVASAAAAGHFPARSTWTRPTWRVSLDHSFTPDILGYLSYNRGFKSGSYNPIGLTSAPFEPETIDAYEIGLKNEFFDRRVRFNLSAFYYNYTNIQVKPPQTISFVVLVANAPVAVVKGLDADLQAVIKSNLKLNVGLSFLSSEYRGYVDGTCVTLLPNGGNGPSAVCNLSGKQLVEAPDFTGNVGANYTVPLAEGSSLDFAVLASYNSGFPFEPSGRLRQSPYALVNGSITWKSADGVYDLQIWTRNLTNAYYYEGMTAVSSDTYTPAEPRTFGVTAGYKF